VSVPENRPKTIKERPVRQLSLHEDVVSTFFVVSLKSAEFYSGELTSSKYIAVYYYRFEATNLLHRELTSIDYLKVPRFVRKRIYPGDALEMVQWLPVWPVLRPFSFEKKNSKYRSQWCARY